MIKSHWQAASGAITVTTREEPRFIQRLLAELPDAPVATVAAPGGQVRAWDRSLPNGPAERPIENCVGLDAGYKWASEGPGRILVCFDWHVLCNTPGHWRKLIEALPRLRAPKDPENSGIASLVVFVGPAWDFIPQNPLRGQIPNVDFAPPTRAELGAIAASLAPTNGQSDAVSDALCGLGADAATQAAAECLAEKGRWDVPHLQQSRKRVLRDAGLELWEPVPEIGGLSGLKALAESEIIPWVRDRQLAVRRILCAGLPGVGKSYCARWFAYRLGCPCARISFPSLKGSLVGQSEGNLKRCYAAIDAIGADAPVVIIFDEIDTIAREGLDGGTSAGMFAETLTWLQESPARAIVIATLNHLDKLDPALESRFEARFFFDLPTESERKAVAAIHFERLGCMNPCDAAQMTGAVTEGFSSREIAEALCRSVARQSNRKPTAEIIKAVAATITPTSTTQAEQLAAMRKAAGTLRRANDPAEAQAAPKGRRIAGIQ